MRRREDDASPVDASGIPQLAKPLPPELQRAMWRRLAQAGQDNDAELADMLGLNQEHRP